MSTQKVYPQYSFQYIQNKLVELSRQKLNTGDVTPQEQADWTETDTYSPAYIKNKPTLPASIGDVVGPSSSVTDNIVLFNGSTGKLIKDSGVNLSQYQLVLHLTTTGNSGSATLNGGTSTLNIPNYTLAGLGGIGLSSLSASTPLSYNNTTGAFSIQVANTTQNGYLTSTDWNTFNNKQSALGFTPVPTTRTLTINGTAYDLSADRSWTISASGMTNPMTTAGDIIYGGTSGTPTRLGIGTTGYFLQAGASAPSWFNLFGTANTWTALQTFNPSVTASGAIARAVYITSTLTAAANNDVLVALDINPTFTLGAFTGVTQAYFRTPNTNSATGKGGVYIGGNNAAAGTDLTASPDLNIGYGNTSYTYMNFLPSTVTAFGQIFYSNSTGYYAGMQFIINGTSSTTNIYSYKFTFKHAGRLATIGQEADTIHVYSAPSYNNFYLRMSSNNDNTRYFKIFTDNASAAQTERFGIQGYSNSALAYFNNVAGVGINVVSPTANLHLGASTTAKAALRFASGVAPTTPNDGDMWYDGTNVNFRIGTTTTQLANQSGLATISDITASCTFTGWSSFVDKQVISAVIGNFVMIFYRVSGTSNATSASITVPYTNQYNFIAANMTYAVNGGSLVTPFGTAGMLNNSAIIVFAPNSTGNTTAWTASGTKTCNGQVSFTKV
jgi:hypothetical protein